MSFTESWAKRQDQGANNDDPLWDAVCAQLDTLTADLPLDGISVDNDIAGRVLYGYARFCYVPLDRPFVVVPHGTVQRTVVVHRFRDGDWLSAEKSFDSHLFSRDLTSSRSIGHEICPIDGLAAYLRTQCIADAPVPRANEDYSSGSCILL